MTARALWSHAVDALFPPRCLLCDEVLGLLPECPACKGELARLSRGHAPGIAAAPLVLDGAFAAFWYEDGVREAVHRMKYAGRAWGGRRHSRAVRPKTPCQARL